MKKESEDLLHIYDIDNFNISDLDVLLHETLKHARELLSAQAGTIYVKDGDVLKFHVFQNDLMSYENIYRQYYLLKDLTLPLDTKNEYLSVDAFNNDKILMIDDIYNSSEYTFLGTKSFDEKFNYKSHSVLSVPLINPIDKTKVGVIQLLNKTMNNEILAFDMKDKEIISMLSSFIALSISRAKDDVYKLTKANENLKKAKNSLEHIIDKEIKSSQKKSVAIFHEARKNTMEEMLSNIAHQWRQPLSTISTLASGLSVELQLDRVSKDDAMSQLRKIVITTQNLSHTIDEFKSLYDTKPNKEHFLIEETIQKVLSLSEIILSVNKISVVNNLTKDLGLDGLKSEFIQTLVNIITHIKENFSKNMRLTENRVVFLDSYVKNQVMHIEIKDNTLTNLEEKEYFSNVEIFNISLYLAKLIVQKYFDGDLEHDYVEYEYRRSHFKGHLYTILIPL